MLIFETFALILLDCSAIEDEITLIVGKINVTGEPVYSYTIENGGSDLSNLFPPFLPLAGGGSREKHFIIHFFLLWVVFKIRVFKYFQIKHWEPSYHHNRIHQTYTSFKYQLYTDLSDLRLLQNIEGGGYNNNLKYFSTVSYSYV